MGYGYSTLAEITRRFGPEHYAVDLSEIRTRPTSERVCVVSQELFDALDDYTRSCPTSPRSGRVYKKNLDWRPETPDNWWIYFVRNGTWEVRGEQVRGQLHHPFKLVVR